MKTEEEVRLAQEAEAKYKELLGKVIRQAFIKLVKDAERDGFIVTVSQEPLQPLAMRNYESVVSVREKR